jgi:hypothetical protein
MTIQPEIYADFLSRRRSARSGTMSVIAKASSSGSKLAGLAESFLVVGSRELDCACKISKKASQIFWASEHRPMYGVE